MEPEAQKEYSGDSPIMSRKHDRFGRGPFAERVAEVIATRTDPTSLVVAIYGPWGDGKTSVLNMMRERLADHRNTVVVPFNPWNFENQRALISSFFDTLSDALGKSLTTRAEEVGKLMSKYGSVLSFASVPFGVDLGTATTQAGEKISNVEIEELKTRLGNLLNEEGKRVVVFVDDIDRLDRSEVHAVMKLVKLSANFQNTAYVLAFDEDVVSASLGERYGSGGLEAGRNFIEKIVQVPLHLPDAESADLRQLTFEGVDEVLSANGITLTEDEAQAFVRHFQEGILPALHTPRQAKRYINAIRFALPLLKGEVNVVDQLHLEAIRTVFPKLYLSIRLNPETYLGSEFSDRFGRAEKIKESAKTTIEQALEGLTSAERDGAIWVLKALFPRLESIFGGSSYGDDWEERWSSEKRLTSSDYFRRFFQYAVPARDVADADIDRLIATANTKDEKETLRALHSVTVRKAWDRTLDKLFARTKELNPVGASTLALAISQTDLPGLFRTT